MKKRIIPFTLLVIYLVTLIKILVIKDLAMVRVGIMRFDFGGTQEGIPNLILFKTILYYIQGHKGFLIAFINIVGNIIALTPLGFLVPFIFSKINWEKIILLSVTTGLAIELTQMFLHIGIFDIDDVILNSLGVMIGFWKFKIFSKFSKKTKSIVTSILIGILGLFFLFYVLSFYKILNMPIAIEPSVKIEMLPTLKNSHQEIGNEACCDLCNGTGGTGKIIGIDENSITIRSVKGIKEMIRMTVKTKIKNSKGEIEKNNLKVGNAVTVIIDETEIASLILVCGIAEK